MAIIKFTLADDGMVDYTVLLDEREDMLSLTGQAAFALAKRGLTKGETERYKLRGSFRMEVQREQSHVKIEGEK